MSFADTVQKNKKNESDAATKFLLKPNRLQLRKPKQNRRKTAAYL